MGCLTGNARRVGEGLQGVASRSGEWLDGFARRVGEGLTGVASRSGEWLDGFARRIGEGLQGVASIACGLGDVHWVRVSPEDVQWLVPDEDIVYIVESDTSWVVE